ncbi:deoxyribodipyrimidine photo-lyase [Maricaulis sp.]|uniref:cryptochrome/photolyase family protein n=1 Tax=Maricaulis sp. TaxID=1486257 RepID=UPI001B19A2B5|nr:deoxyribodipyrimidine photo-lyase [Maricaulis sp.]MBO6797907.1 deoxyribodipyrimidine photo-lyase [Maricaulis sp.]
MATAEATQPAIVWFGRDLRLTDHPALHAAVRSGRPLICIYIKEAFQSVSLSPGAASNWWLHHSLKAHSRELARLGATLHLLSGEASVLLPHLVRKFNVAELFWNQTEIPWIDERDRHLAHRLIEMGCQPRVFRSTTLTQLDTIRNKQGDPFRVFSAFWRAAQPTLGHERALPAPETLRVHDEQPEGEDLDSWNLCPAEPNWAAGFGAAWKPGERNALARLAEFTSEDLGRYPEERDRPDLDTTSRLSPCLAHGELSARTVWQACLEAEVNGVSARAIEKFQAELGWRDFAYYLFWHFGDLRNENFNAKFDNFPWREDSAAFRSWTRGETGFPIVDAGMRQLWQTGWMHNRVRMITASFLVKHLGIHWQQGMRWFEDTLVDADTLVNAASWQWVAGSGADAAPYFRIFNPLAQAEKFDPRGTYVRRYVPEHAQGFGTYPDEIIDLKERRNWALEAFKSLPS